MTFHIRRDEKPDEGLRRIAREQIGIVLSHYDDPALADDVRIHSLRARCKKMRALLRLAGPVMGPAFAVEDTRFRDAGAGVGDVRDGFVQTRAVRELMGLEGHGGASPDAGTCGDPALARAIESMRAALAAVDDWPLPVTGFYDLAPGYGRTWRKARNAWLRALWDRSDEHFHKLRKWAKYLWYQTRILERANRKRLHPQRVQLQVIGELLGHAHDLAVLESGIHVEAGDEILRIAVQRKHRLYRRALHLCSKTFAATADEQVADVARWWQAWRHPEY